MSLTPSLALLWMRLGPYHLARLQAAAALFSARGIAVHGIEVAGTDSVYAWDAAPGADGFARHTLFPASAYEDHSPREIASAVMALLERLQPGAVAINGWGVPEARAALRWARRRGTRAVVMSETLDPGPGRNPAKELAKRWLVGQFGAALVGGRPHADYVERLGMPRDRVFRGYDVVDNEHFMRGADAARANDARLRAELALPPRYFFCNTRFLPRKNIAGVLRALALHRKRLGDRAWSLVISGSGETEASDRALARELGPALGPGAVTWTGFLQYPELPARYGLASAFVHAATHEPWGLVLNEAAAAGLPLLSSRAVGSAHELLEEGRNGLLFDPGSPESIARAMDRMALMPEGERRAMGEASRVIVGRWGPGRFARGLARAVQAAAGRRSSP